MIFTGRAWGLESYMLELETMDFTFFASKISPLGKICDKIFFCDSEIFFGDTCGEQELTIYLQRMVKPLRYYWGESLVKKQKTVSCMNTISWGRDPHNFLSIKCIFCA